MGKEGEGRKEGERGGKIILQKKAQLPLVAMDNATTSIEGREKSSPPVLT